MLETINEIYASQFNEAKTMYAKIDKANADLVGSYEYEVLPTDYQDIKKEKNIIKQCNQLVLDLLGPQFESRGLCSILSSPLLVSSAILFEQDYAFLTIGKILDQNNGNLFNVPARENVISKIIEDYNSMDNILLGSNLHVWITLGNGLIIDPSIELTLNNHNEVIVGLPNEISNKYRYEPYFVSGMEDLRQIHNTTSFPSYVAKAEACLALTKHFFNEANLMHTHKTGYYT